MNLLYAQIGSNLSVMLGQIHVFKTMLLVKHKKNLYFSKKKSLLVVHILEKW